MGLAANTHKNEFLKSLGTWPTCDALGVGVAGSHKVVPLVWQVGYQAEHASSTGLV